MVHVTVAPALKVEHGLAGDTVPGVTLVSQLELMACWPVHDGPGNALMPAREPRCLRVVARNA